MRVIKAALPLLVLGASTLLFGSNALADARIVTSIKPLELLVRAIATEDMEISTLVPPGSSPHNYSIAPSNRRALESADIVFWVGPGMETFLTRLLTGSEFGERSIALMATDARLENAGKVADNHDGHDEGYDSSHDDEHHGHDHGDGEDPHIWVDPYMAVAMAQDIRDALVTLEGTDSRALDHNLAEFRAAVLEKETQIRKQLEPVTHISLFAYHTAFIRFAEHYNLRLAGVLTLNPELSPGARHIAEVQNKLRAADTPCLLTEPQFNRQWWRSITEGLDVTFSTWDPLATDIEATANGYAAFQQSIADAVLACLPENAEH